MGRKEILCRNVDGRKGAGLRHFRTCSDGGSPHIEIAEDRSLALAISEVGVEAKPICDRN